MEAHNDEDTRVSSRDVDRVEKGIRHRGNAPDPPLNFGRGDPYVARTESIDVMRLKCS